MKNFKSARAETFELARSDSEYSSDFEISSELSDPAKNKYQRPKSQQKVSLGHVEVPPDTEKQSLTFDAILVNGKNVFSEEQKNMEDFKSDEFATIIKSNFR